MILHILSSAAVAAGLFVGTPGTENPTDQDPSMNIVETAVSAGSFNTLVTAVKAADLVETLSSPGPFTVFAPTDEAFAEIPADRLNALLADKEALTAVLTYHVVAGKVMSGDVVKLSSAATVNGQSVDIKVMDGKVMIDGAEVVTADIEATNGVIHVINKVILPDM
ncbi:MAG: fasciclin domain-containing protein [Gemmatimonadetes bacterium]|nr:fasciclin domain-containing protein [Gemmatimonadota bacterium]NNM05766.1 fasciclin domain-containing protein [Gemmatimonadota bacterium]